VSLEERRLRGVEVREPLLLRLVSGARLVAIATGMRANRGSDRGGELLQPPSPAALAHRVAGLVLRAPDPTLAPLTAHGRAAMRRRYLRALAAVLGLFACLAAGQVLAGWPSWLWWLAALAVPAAAALAADRYRGLGHAVLIAPGPGHLGPGATPAGRGSGAGYLVTRHGSIDRRTAALRTDAIIGWRIRQSFFQRRVGLATLTATTAGGHGAYRVPDVPLGEALACAETALPGLLSAFERAPGHRDLPPRAAARR